MVASVRSASQAGAATGNPVVTKPAGTADGDLLLAICFKDTDSAGGVTAPLGWTQRGSTTTQTGVSACSVFTKLAVAEGASYTFTGNPGSTSTVAMLAITAADTTTPVDVGPAFGGGAASTSHVAPSVSPVGADSLLVCSANALISGAVPTTYTPPGGMTEQTDLTTGNWLTQTSATQELAASGATGTKTFTCSRSMPHQTVSIAIKSAGGGGEAHSGTGTTSAASALSSTGAKGAAGVAAIAVAATLLVAGAKGAVGSSGIDATSALSSTGTKAATGNGSVAATASLTGSGTGNESPALSGTGTISAASSLSSTGAADRSGTSSIAAASNLSSAGVAARSGNGTVASTATLTGSGSASENPAASGTGTISAATSLISSGTKAALGASSIAAVGAVSSVGSRAAAGTVTIAVTAALSGAGFGRGPVQLGEAVYTERSIPHADHTDREGPEAIHTDRTVAHAQGG